MKFVYHHRIASKDGQFVHVDELTRALRARGVDLTIIGPGGTGAAGFGQQNPMVARLKRLLPKAAYELLELGYSAVAFLKLRAAVRSHRPDCLYERYNLFSPAGAWIRKRYGIPLILEVNAPLFEERSLYGGIALRRLAHWSQRYAWRNADKVLPVTQVLADIVQESGVPPGKICVIPNGIDIERYASVPDSAQAKRDLGFGDFEVLGFTGFMREWHELERVIDLVANDTTGRRVALLVGDGPARPGLEAYATARGVRERVRITGVVDQKDVARHIAAFDIALQPHVVSYASPLKLFDYMVQGKAIVAPNMPNIREILTDGVNSVLFNLDDSTSFNGAVEKLLMDDDFRCELGDRARKDLLDAPYTWQYNAQRVQNIISEILAG